MVIGRVSHTCHDHDSASPPQPNQNSKKYNLQFSKHVRLYERENILVLMPSANGDADEDGRASISEDYEIIQGSEGGLSDRSAGKES